MATHPARSAVQPQQKPPKMNYVWTPIAARPSRLYRVVNPNSACEFDEKEGFTAADTTTRYNFRGTDRTEGQAFYASIQNHRDGERILSPYISVFGKRAEAESWTLAAEELFGKGCYMAEIDAKHETMEDRSVWCVLHIQWGSQMSGFLNSAKDREANPNLPARDISTGLRNSEWLILHKIPAEAIVSRTTPDQIREKRESLPHSPLLPIPDNDSIVRTCTTLGEYWLLPDPNAFPAECDCLDDPCSCRMEQEALGFIEGGLGTRTVTDGTVSQQIVDTRPFMRAVLFDPFAEGGGVI